MRARRNKIGVKKKASGYPKVEIRAACSASRGFRYPEYLGCSGLWTVLIPYPHHRSGLCPAPQGAPPDSLCFHSYRPRRIIHTHGELSWQKQKSTGMAGSGAYPISFLAVLFLNCCSWQVSWGGSVCACACVSLAEVMKSSNGLGGLKNWTLFFSQSGAESVSESGWEYVLRVLPGSDLLCFLMPKRMQDSFLGSFIRTIILLSQGPPSLQPHFTFCRPHLQIHWGLWLPMNYGTVSP